MTLAIRPVLTSGDRQAFLDVPFAIYRDDPNWVAPLYVERQEHLDPRKNPYFRHAEAQLFVAWRDGVAVGRISAQLCALRTERYHDGKGQFGFLEAPDDPDVFAALLDAAQDWLRAHGCTAMQGPFSFSINDEMGLLVEGFDTPPSMMMGHARSWYGPRLEEQGFVKAKDVIAYSFDGKAELPRAMRTTLDKALSAKDMVIRPFRKRDMQRDLAAIIDIFNDAWSDNWGFVPFTPEEIAALAKNLKMLVRDDYIAIAEYRGQPAAMAVTLPNINDWIRGLDGRLLPFGWITLLRHLLRRRPRSVRMPLMGVRKAHHGTLAGAAMAIGVIDHVRRYHQSRGFEQAELSWVLEDNLPMRRIIEQLCGVPYKTYRIYERPIA